MKRAVNWILNFFGYHLAKDPKPYARRQPIVPDLLMQLIDDKRCPDHGTDYKQRCNVCRYIGQIKAKAKDTPYPKDAPYPNR